jgi:hypothetical protein
MAATLPARIFCPDQEIAWSRVVRESLSQLLNDPATRGMTGDVEMEDAPAVVADYKKAIQHAERDGGHSEEVHGCDCFPVIAQEGKPAFAWLWVSGRFVYPS